MKINNSLIHAFFSEGCSAETASETDSVTKDALSDPRFQKLAAHVSSLYESLVRPKMEAKKNCVVANTKLGSTI